MTDICVEVCTETARATTERPSTLFTGEPLISELYIPESFTGSKYGGCSGRKLTIYVYLFVFTGCPEVSNH